MPNSPSIERSKSILKCPSTLEEKKEMVKVLLDVTGSRRDIHRKILLRLKKINNISKVMVNILSGVSVSSIVLSLTPLSPIFLIISLCSTSIASLATAGTSGFRLSSKIEDHARSYNLYSDLNRDYSAKIRKNHLSSPDYDELLDQLNKIQIYVTLF